MNLRRSSTFSPISVVKIVLRLDHVFELHLQQRARLGVHGGGPELVGIHLPQALEARDGELLLGVLEHESQHLRGVLLAHLVAIARDRERRLIRGGDGPAQRPQPLLVGRRSQRPIDARRMARAISQHQLMQAVLLVIDDLAFHLDLGLFDGLEQRLQRFLVLEIRFLFEIAGGQQVHQRAVAQAAAAA